MGKASKKTALSTKTNAAPGQKVLTKAQEKKAKLKAEIAAAKAQGDLAKTAMGFNPLEQFEQIRQYRQNDLDLTLEFFKGSLSPEIEEAAKACSLLPTARLEDVNWLVAKGADAAPAAVAGFHFGFEEEVMVMVIDWMAVAEGAQRKGLGRFLVNAMGDTAQHVQMKGLWAPIPTNAQRVVAKAFLKANGFEVDETDQSKVNTTQADKAKFEVMSRITDEETRAFLKEQGEKQKKQWAAHHKAVAGAKKGERMKCSNNEVHASTM